MSLVCLHIMDTKAGHIIPGCCICRIKKPASSRKNTSIHHEHTISIHVNIIICALNEVNTERNVLMERLILTLHDIKSVSL